MKHKLCQSCGMPLSRKEDIATNADQSKNEEYCIYCFKDGSFTSDCTMNEMIEKCLSYLDEFNKDSNVEYTREEAMKNMQDFFPKLKRWS